MAALTEGRNTPELSEGGRVVVLPVLGGAKIFDGSIVVIDSDGMAQAGTKTEGLITVGRAEEYVDNTGGSDGAVTIMVRRGVFVFDNSAVALNKVNEEDLFKACYIEDDCTVSSVSIGSSVAGKVIGVFNDGSVAVEMGLAGINLTIVEAAALLAITGTGVVSGDMFEGYVLTGIDATKTVIIDGNTYTMAAATSNAANEFADFTGLVTIAATDGIIIIGSNFDKIQASKVSA